jgi:cytochrome c551/c552
VNQFKNHIMKKLMITGCIGIFILVAASCGSDSSKTEKPASGSEAGKTANGNPSYDPHRGEGKFTKVDIGPSLNVAMAEAGNKVFNVKCSGCHKLTDEKLVGPGWKGITSRHAPEWIMNFITNTDDMLDKDPKAQAQLEICLVRMPNQNLSDDDARAIYEFQRKNDGVK